MQESEFREVYSEYSRPLYSYVLWMSGCRAAADDVLQTAFLKVWQSDSMPPPGGQRKAWLYAVCRNACLDYLRSASRRVHLRARYALEHPSYIEEPLGENLIWSKLNDLPETDRTVVYLHVRMGWSYAEVAQMMKTTENNVRVRAFRAFRRLRHAFTERP